ncbi:GntR family transcriptional regulator [Paenibacillus sp. CAA11]|uniref:GntR family transcriptional regulator n=1 Tax=Paenibacillus sp. CAA11 TaxID=1532905 RepID=UPI000D3C82FC|nr:GntR family transcriptional regulator [Paenibacillus sp. CAA11]AWB46211.1 GntR family transcriptional regulator [Paenibacillus sp. CAA11]
MNSRLSPSGHSAGNLVYSQLKEQIMSLELVPGTNLSEKETALACKVSRTPVRESFVRLAQEGLVVVLPQRGTQVSLIDPDQVEEARFMREQLERAIIRLACEAFPKDQLMALEHNLELQQECIRQHDGHGMFKLDEAFHRLLFEGCRKLATWSVLQHMNAHLNRSRMLWLTTDPSWEHLYEQHCELIEAIRQHERHQADSLMQEHLSLSISDLSLLRGKYPDYFAEPREL